MMLLTNFKNPFYKLILLILIIGIFLRFINLDKKIYWHDEIYTSLHITGYLSNEWKSKLFNGQIIGINDLQYYLHINPQKTLNDTLNVLAIDDPHHPPLYYILVRYWRHLFGDSIIVIRSFSTVMSLFVFPAIYWFCWELFQNSIIGLITIALVAISPFYILYAQEAREYALWTVIILISNSWLLKAIKVTQNHHNIEPKIIRCWLIYSGLNAISLYISFVSVFIIIPQTIYTIILENFRLTKITILQGISILISVILFIPWIVVFICNYEQYQRSTSWTKLKIPSWEILKIFALNITRIFFAIDQEFETLLNYLSVIICLILVGYAIFFLIKNTSIMCWGLILCLIITPIVLLVLPDLIIGGIRSLSPRYLIPCFIAIDISIAYLLGSKLIDKNTKNIKIWSIIIAIIISGGMISSAVNSQNDTAWTKVISYSLPEVARIINKTQSPLLISDGNGYNSGNIMSLSYLLNPDVKLQLLSNTKDYQLPPGFKHIFLLSPSDEFRLQLEKQKGLKANFVFQDIHLNLWEIEH
ncbi:glycosyltransferase family 39 protein [Aphanothece sacrum]|uniref:Dolichyl-phosphate-mannose-mannosyltransferase family protein n=1 Tax=Aphanothece sacrum FPU1 TaxID=1920663 RepID=A0A401IDU7_APHSA|nr:glycosyltransferase family 39 protein [Aphanothece sacrum]GBF79457.1 dolichyl-phosphate-mannose-mannosyltransferase family protein [Aphanothece sacrum FPU1]GBF85993.1 dolichyl-phosphate-mannose-mannosyltransferase family protein [Aphanothece sacrum FPU3]